jgi:anti-sigma28 factor (negative regulator of flagellin synthesis)
LEDKTILNSNYSADITDFDIQERSDRRKHTDFHDASVEYAFPEHRLDTAAVPCKARDRSNIESIAAKIKNGTYHVNAADVARRILTCD